MSERFRRYLSSDEDEDSESSSSESEADEPTNHRTASDSDEDEAQADTRVSAESQQNLCSNCFLDTGCLGADGFCV